ncbi:hypothetical protein EDB89DRAFT_24398 [Lactarius sanguifluus]|nr:hypothetical protein EDB89DRAFT_24398 [Lactarius sanguifluus]
MILWMGVMSEAICTGLLSSTAPITSFFLSFPFSLSLSPPFLPPFPFSRSRCLYHVHCSRSPFAMEACCPSRSTRREPHDTIFKHPCAVLWASSNSPFHFGKVVNRIPDCNWSYFFGLRCMEDTFQLEAQEGSHRSRAPIDRV